MRVCRVESLGQRGEREQTDKRYIKSMIHFDEEIKMEEIKIEWKVWDKKSLIEKSQKDKKQTKKNS